MLDCIHVKFRKLGSLHGNDGNSEGGLLHLASLLQAGKQCDAAVGSRDTVLSVAETASKWCVDVAGALGSSSSGHICNVDKGTCESNIENDGDESENCNASEAAEEDKAGEREDDCNTRDTFDGANVGVDVQVVVLQGREEVGEEGENDCSAEEFNTSKEPLQCLEGHAGFASHVCGLMSDWFLGEEDGLVKLLMI